MALTDWERQELEALREIVRAQAKLIEAYEHKMGWIRKANPGEWVKPTPFYNGPTAVDCNTPTEGDIK